MENISQKLNNSEKSGWEQVSDVPFQPEIPEYIKSIINGFSGRQETAKRQIDSAEERLMRDRANYNEIKNLPDDAPMRERKIANAEIVMHRDEVNVERQKAEYSIMREPIPDDISYRARQHEEFAKKVAEKLPEDSPLCFHGTGILGAKGIISSGGIQSSADRLGYQTSWDAEGQISITTRHTLDTTVKGYTNLEKYDFPAGCIFVMLPKAGEKLDKASTTMDSIDFTQNPERLVSVITTPENIERVAGWMQEANLPAERVTDFDSFIEQLPSISEELSRA